MEARRGQERGAGRCLPHPIRSDANAIVQSGQPIVSFAYGAGNQTRLSEAQSMTKQMIYHAEHGWTLNE